MNATVRWYFGFASIAISVATIVLAFAYLPIMHLLGTDKIQGTLRLERTL
jgi:hypothetical protein